MAAGLYALGLVLLVEGLLWALAPHLVEDLLEALWALSLEERRFAGLAALAGGAALVWAAGLMGAVTPS